MPFTVLRQDEQDLMADQAKLHDRNAGLLLPVLVERRVRDAVKRKLRDHATKQLFNFYFGSDDGEGGILGAPATCAKLAFSLDIYDETMLDDVLRIVKIRNAFAHKPSTNEFKDNPVAGYIRDLQLPEKYPKMDPKDWTTAGKTREQLDQDILRWSNLEDTAPPRHRFLRSIEIVLTWLTIRSGHKFEYRDSKISPIRPHPHTLASPST